MFCGTRYLSHRCTLLKIVMHRPMTDKITGNQELLTRTRQNKNYWPEHGKPRTTDQNMSNQELLTRTWQTMYNWPAYGKTRTTDQNRADWFTKSRKVCFWFCFLIDCSRRLSLHISVSWKWRHQLRLTSYRCITTAQCHPVIYILHSSLDYWNWLWLFFAVFSQYTLTQQNSSEYITASVSRSYNAETKQTQHQYNLAIMMNGNTSRNTSTGVSHKQIRQGMNNSTETWGVMTRGWDITL